MIVGVLVDSSVGVDVTVGVLVAVTVDGSVAVGVGVTWQNEPPSRSSLRRGP